LIRKKVDPKSAFFTAENAENAEQDFGDRPECTIRPGLLRELNIYPITPFHFLFFSVVSAFSVVKTA
jgi:hypothetical protein